MKTNRKFSVIGKTIRRLALPLLAIIFVNSPVFAQFDSDFQTNIINGATNDWAGDYLIGSNSVFNALLIQNRGALSNNTGLIGLMPAANSNSAVVTGIGSLWHNRNNLFVGNSGSGNSLLIDLRASVFDDHGVVGSTITSSNNSVTVTRLSAMWSNRVNLYIGGSGPGNSLLISSLGRVFNGYGFLGFYPSSSNNSVLVTGAASVWSNRLDLHVGENGPGNSLVISNQGRLFNNEGVVGLNSSGNQVLVTGSNSVWNSLGNLFVGVYGAGNSMTISNQGRVFNEQAVMGPEASSSNNLALVTDPGSVWSNRASLYVGARGSGNSLFVSNQGKVYNESGYVGYYSNSLNNAVAVSGSGSVWANAGSLYVGRSGAGNSLLITNQGRVLNQFCYVGYNSSSSNNSVLVSGSGSVWSNDYHVVGEYGPGNSLLINKQARVFSRIGVLGDYLGSSNNSAVVTDTGSLWQIPEVLYVGFVGSANSLVISNQGRVISGGGYVGGNRGDNNSVLVTGSGSVWNTADLVVGMNGLGNSLVISNQGTVLSGRGYFGSSNNFALVTGGGSTWRIADDLQLGSLSPGNILIISNRGAVFSGRSYLGDGQDSTNNFACVTGAGSVWSNSDLSIGFAGSGNRLAISDQGKVLGSSACIGCLSVGSSNDVWVTGAGSVWSNRFLTVGNEGSGNSLVISNQGAVYDDYGIVGAGSASNGSNNCVRVLDNGLWHNKSDLHVGRGLNNELVIAGGSVLASNAFISFADPLFGSGTNNSIRVDSGNLVVTNRVGNGALIVSAGGVASLILNGGDVTVDRLLLTNGDSSVIVFNGGTLHSKGTAATNNHPFIVGNGTSTATFHLLGGIHSFNDGLLLRANSFLTGCGTIQGSVLINPGATVQANCGGALIFTDDVTNNGLVIVDNGGRLESSDTFVNNGTILLLNGGATDFRGTFINKGVMLNGNLRLAIARDASAGYFIRFTCTPDITYVLQRAARVTGPWSDLATSTAPASGLIEYHDTSPPGKPSTAPRSREKIQVGAADLRRL